MSPAEGSARAFLRALFDEAVAAVSAERCMPEDLGPPAEGRTVIIAVGKAAAAMASVAARAPFTDSLASA